MHPTDLTVSAVVYHDGRYLIVRETAGGRAVLSQPGGHIESGESPEDALLREVYEETGCTVRCRDPIGVYLWIHPQSRQQFLRLMYVAEYQSCDESHSPDDSIISRLWLTREEVEANVRTLRNPAVLRSIQDFEAGRRESDALISDMLPLQENVDQVLATANLV